MATWREAKTREDLKQLDGRKLRKAKFRLKLLQCLAEYQSMLLCVIDHVGSNQMQQVRAAIRGKATVLCGKNTMMRRIMQDIIEEGDAGAIAGGANQLTLLLSSGQLKYNVCLIFSNPENLAEVRKAVIGNKVPAAARTGVLAPIDVTLPAGPTGLDPGQTAFFQAMNIATKISRGSIELIQPKTIIQKGTRVGSSAVALLAKMNIKPFFFGIEVKSVVDGGSMYDAAILEMTQADLIRKFMGGVSYVACLSLAAKYPTLASLVHSMSRGFQMVAAISVETDYTIEEVKELKALLSDPEALAKMQAAAAAAAAGGGGGDTAAEAAPAAAPEPEEEEEEAAGGMDLFGGGDEGGGDY
jgi:large subunit ribosomal protein LP0